MQIRRGKVYFSLHRYLKIAFFRLHISLNNLLSYGLMQNSTVTRYFLRHSSSSADIVWIYGVDVSVISGDRVSHVVDNLQLPILVVETISKDRKNIRCGLQLSVY